MTAGRKITYRTGGGCLVLFGFPFALGGVCVCYSSIAGNMEGAPWWVGVLFSIPFLAVGFGLMTYRAVVEFDPASGRWASWWGFLFPIRKLSGVFEDARAVHIRREVRRSKNSTYTVFPVKVVINNLPDLDVQEERDYIAARRIAERIARAVSIPLHDMTGDTPVVTEPDDLDLSVRDKIRKGGGELVIPEEPASRKSTYEIDGSTVIFTLPPVGAGHALVGVLAAAVPTVIVVVFFLMPLLGEEGMPSAMKYVFVGFLSLFILLPLMAGFRMVARGLWERNVIEVSPRGVKRFGCGLTGTREDVLEAGKIEDITVKTLGTGASEVVVVTDDEVLKFGKHLDEPEKSWMVRVIQVILAS